MALILAGCLAISPVSAGLYTTQAFAAETDTISEISEATQQTPLVIVVKDENDVALTESGKETEAEKYTVKVGETRRLTAFIEQGSDSPVLSEWSSDAPEIISIDDEGVITARSAGVGKISLSISADAAQDPLLIEFEIVVTPEEEEASEINADEAAATSGSDEAASASAETAEASASAEPAAEMPQAEEAEVTAETAEINEDAEAAVTAPAEQTENAAESAAAATTEETEEVTQTEDTAEPAAPAATAETAAPAEVETTDPTTAAETATTDPATTVETTDPAAQATTADPAAAVEATDPAAAAATADPAATTQATDPAAELTGNISVDAATVTANADAKVTSKTGTVTVVKPHWEGSGTDWSYIKSDGTKATGLLTLRNRTFCLSTKGKLRYGWIKLGPYYYYADGEGELITGWFKSYNSTYYFRNDHTMAIGITTINNKRYIFKQNGVMKTGWCRYNGNYYYLGSNGVAKTGWQTIGKGRYLFQSDGAMKTGWLTNGNRMYYFASNGCQVTGLQKIGSSTYYLRQDGVVTNGWKLIGNYWYYFTGSKMRTGWLQLRTRKFYLDSNGRMVTGTRTIDGKRYEFDSEGILVVNRYTYNNTQEFIECIAPLVKKYAPAWGVKVYSPIIAQAILESASGESSLGKVYNNYFGLKCGTLWKGKSVNLRTGEEYTPGTYTTISANFRVYDNMEEGVEGYFIFLFKNRTRYNNLIGETDPYEYLVKIKADGYATSSKYVQNVYNVIKYYDLTRFDD